MKFYFDYFYYRIFKLFIKERSDKGSRAIFFITMVEVCLFLGILQIALVFFCEKDGIELFLSYYSWLVLLVIFPVGFINYNMYRDRYNEFDDYWGNETKRRRVLKGLLMILTAIVAFGILFYSLSYLNKLKR